MFGREEIILRIHNEFFIDVDTIKRDLALPFYHSLIKTSVVAEGFVILGCEFERDRRVTRHLMESAIRHSKPLFVLGPDTQSLSVVNEIRAAEPNLSVVTSNDSYVRRVPQNYTFLKGDEGSFAYLVLVPEDYLLRRFLSREVLLNPATCSSPQNVKPQIVVCIGVPPTTDLLEERTIAAIKEANYVVMFDRTRHNILSHLQIGTSVIVRYDYYDYSANIGQIDAKLGALHRRGIYNVSLLVEGHPEIYDLVECLPHANREFRIQPMKPLLLFAVEKLEAAFGIDILGRGFVLTSGYNVRHGITTSQLTSEIESYLSTEVSICVMEMFLGDLPLVLRLLESSKAAKCVFVLTNMFSQEQNIYFIASNRFAEIAWVDQVKGRFTSLIVIDAMAVSHSARAAIQERLGDHAKL
jgi:hypothetical protein